MASEYIVHVKDKHHGHKYGTRTRDSDNHLRVKDDKDCHSATSGDETFRRPRALSLHSSLLQRPLQGRSRRHSVAVDAARTREHAYMDSCADSVAHCLFEAMKLSKDDHEKDTSDRPRSHNRSRSFKEKSERLKSEHSFHRVRSFKTTSKGIVDKAETMISREQASPAADGDLISAERDNLSASDSITCSITEVTESRLDDRATYYRVLALGTEGVGKTSIIDQFITSECVESDATNVARQAERRVTLEVDGRKTVLEFLQAEDFQGNAENLSVNGFLVVFATTDRQSWNRAVEVLKHLREEVGLHKAVILVGNKTDLVRHRAVSTEEGRRMADSYGCKYIETSAVLNLQMEDLLVGICKQISLKTDHLLTTSDRNEEHGYNQRRSSFHRAKRFLQKVFHVHGSKEKNTENLYVD